MLSRSLVLVPVARRALLKNVPALSGAASRLAHHGPPAGYKFPTMDDMLVPCGSWQEDYDNKQRKYNIHLLFGAGFFIITFAVGIYSDAFALYYFAPEKPGPRR